MIEGEMDSEGQDIYKLCKVVQNSERLDIKLALQKYIKNDCGKSEVLYMIYMTVIESKLLFI